MGTKARVAGCGLAAVALVGAILTVVLGAWAIFALKRARAVWPAEAAIVEVPAAGLPPDPEAWGQLVALIEAMPSDLDTTFVQDALAGTGAPSPVEVAWDRLEAPMAAMDRVVEGGGLVPPVVPLDQEGPRYVTVLQAARLRLLRAWRYAEQDRDAEAVAEMLRVERLGLLLEHAHGSLLATMVGVAVEDAALDEITDLLTARPYVPSQALAGLQAELEAGLALPPALPGAIVGECHGMEATFDEMRHWDRERLFAATRPGASAAPGTADGDGCCPPFYDPDRTIRLLRWRCAGLMAAAGVLAAERVWPTFDQLFRRGSLDPGQYLDNPIGRILLDVGAPSFAPHADRLDRLQRKKALVAVRVALRRYELHQEDGGLPATLADLVPAFLAAIPDGLTYDPGARTLSAAAGAETLVVGL